MSQILIAAFDSYEQADQAKQALISEGIASDAIQLSASSNPETVDSETLDIAAGKQHSQSMGDAVSEFIQSVFSDDADVGHYPEAMRRGSTLITVSLDDSAQVAAAEATLTRHGAIDVNERSSQWGEDDRPLTASTEALTTGYPDATSTSSGVTDADKSTAEELAAGDNAIPGRAANRHAPGRDHTAGRVHIVPR
jgi:hypothetical protein